MKAILPRIYAHFKNIRHACALVISVCLCVCLSVCVFSLYAMCNEASGGNADESFCVAALLSQALYHLPPPQPLNT